MYFVKFHLMMTNLQFVICYLLSNNIKIRCEKQELWYAQSQLLTDDVLSGGQWPMFWGLPSGYLDNWFKHQLQNHLNVRVTCNKVIGIRLSDSTPPMACLCNI